MKKTEKLSLILICVLISGIVFSQDYTSYIWDEYQPVNPATVNPALKQMLNDLVDEMIQDRDIDGKYDHLAPMYFSKGISSDGTEIMWGAATQGWPAVEPGEWIFLNVGETLYTLSMAYPYLTDTNKNKVLAFLQTELQAYPPLGSNWGCSGSGAWTNFLSKGVRRELFDPPTSGYNSWPPVEGCIENCYAIWLYARNTGNWSYVTSNWSMIESGYIKFRDNGYTSNPDLKRSTATYTYSEIGGLIGFCRLAQHENKTSLVTEASNLVNLALQGAVNFNNKRTYCDDFIHSRDSHENAIPVFYWLMPEIAKFIRERCGTAPVDYINYLTDKKRKLMWWPTMMFKHGYDRLGSNPDDAFGGENCVWSPLVSWSLFMAKAYIQQETQQTLTGYIDMPWCVGDLYQMQKIIAAIEAEGGTGPGPATKILLSSDFSQLLADGISSTTVRAGVYDASDFLVTTSTAQIRFTLSGTGSLMGTNPVQVQNGIATIIYKAGTSTGTVTITGTSQGLTQGSVQISLVSQITPEITVISPNGGETWPFQTIQTVRWTSQGTVGNVNIDLSTNGSSSWTNLVSNTNNDGIQTITVPNTPSTSCRIRVCETDGNPFDISNNNFIITGNFLPKLKVNIDVLNFGEVPIGKTAVATFDITNEGGGTLSGSVTTDKDWITVTPETFNINNVSINVTVDNEILNQREGVYSGTINITSNGGDAQVLVTLSATCVLVKPNPYNPNKGPLTFFGNGIVQGRTRIKIYTITGQLIWENSNRQNSDSNEIVWDGKDKNGRKVLPGIYIYTYESPEEKGISKFSVE